MDTEMTFPVAFAVVCDYMLADGKWTRAVSFQRETGVHLFPSFQLVECGCDGRSEAGYPAHEVEALGSSRGW